MRSLVIAALAGMGCYHHIDPGLATRDSGPDDDGSAIDGDRRPDAPTCGVDAMILGRGLLQVCVPAGPYTSRVLASSVDTDGSGPIACDQTLTTANGSICVLIGQDLNVSGTLRASGSRALALVALGNISIPMGSEIDASSATGGSFGAGAPASCTPGAANGSPALTSGATGAAGGSFGGDGGVGGADGTGKLGGVAGGVVPLSEVIGGCPGANGGASTNGSGGAGGRGGGAVYLIAASSITIAGRINASGAAGLIAPAQAGGGGGGAGGLIALDAQSYTISGSLFAIGGPGSTGGTYFQSGSQGTTQTTAADTATVTGSHGGGDGGAGRQTMGESGGDGYFDPGGADFGGGGGGGGGGGYILAYITGSSLTETGVSAPPLVLVP